ncbi:MAG: hypothetical protein M3P85_04840 [Actinomycetota bacterium]|nr:hypothetical protein [Actinomycetota bacterium]
MKEIDWPDLKAKMEAGGPPTSDDVSITTDGRRLDSKEKVLEFLAELEAEREAARTEAQDQAGHVPTQL